MQPERFLLLAEVCRRCAIHPGTVRNYRYLGRHKDLARLVPPLVQRGDGKLGCLESVLNKFLADTYGPKEEAA